MAKRNATSELNDRNWDEEEEDEEAGEFVAAKKEVLKQRNIIKAKRRSNISTASPGAGIFANFAGFSSTPNTTTTTAAATTTTTAATLTVTNSTMKPFVDISSSNTSKPIGAMASITGASTDPSKSDSKLHMQLKKLNESVLQWMQQHVAKDPYCILTPIFKDYEKYLKNIQDESSAQSDTKDTGSIPATVTDQKTTLGSEKSKEEDQSKPDLKSSTWTNLSVTNPILSSSSSSSSSTTTTTTLTGQTSILTTTAFGGFNFKPADTQSTFSFAGSLNTSSAAKGSNPEEEDEYVPPKVEVKEIKQEGSVYSKRCKLFYEKDKNWIDKGIGNLHVKPFKDKAQLIIRADTNLGNILLNIMLFPTMQLKRQGKNNVSFVCIPNPPLTKDDSGNKPVPLLIRVKTGEEADDLLAELNKHKLGTDSQENV